MTKTMKTLILMPMLAMTLLLCARPAAAVEVPENAVAEGTAIMVWVDLTQIDAEMIEGAADMLSGAMDNLPMDDTDLGIPMGDMDMDEMLIQIQDFRDEFVEAGAEGILLMVEMPSDDSWSPPFSALVKTAEGADGAAISEMLTEMAEGEAVGVNEYASGWMALEVEGADAVTKEGSLEAAEAFGSQLAEREDAPITVIYRMDDTARDAIDEMMMGDSPEMAMVAGIIQPLKGMDTMALSVYVDDVDSEMAVTLDMAMVFSDPEQGEQFMNSFNGILMLAQGMMGMQMAELENAPSNDTLAEFFNSLLLQGDGEVLTLELGEDFFGLVEELAPAFEEMMEGMGGFGGEGDIF